MTDRPVGDGLHWIADDLSEAERSAVLADLDEAFGDDLLVLEDVTMEEASSLLEAADSADDGAVASSGPHVGDLLGVDVEVVLLVVESSLLLLESSRAVSEGRRRIVERVRERIGDGGGTE